MAVTKSTLNNNLARVSDIGAYISFKEGTYTKKVFIQPDSVIPMLLLGFKQPAGLIDPYQIQYRQTFRRTASEAAKAGSNWTGWTSDWKSARPVPAGGGKPAIPVGNTTNVDSWLRANKGIDKTQRATNAVNYANVTIPAQYDAMSYAIRIRTYNAKTARHGAWVTDEIRLFKCMDIKDISAIVAPDGGLYVGFNHNHSRDIYAVVNSVIFDNREVFTSPEPLRVSCITQERNEQTLPTARAGYFGAMIHIPGEFIDVFLRVNNNVGLNIDFYTDLDAPTRVASTYKIAPAITTITAPATVITSDRARGIVNVRITSAANNEIYNDAGIVCFSSNGVFNEKIKAIAEDKPLSTGFGETICQASFALNMTAETYIFYGCISNQYNRTRYGTQTRYTTDKTQFIYVDSFGSLESHASLIGDASLSLKRSINLTNERPIGRENSMAAWFAGSDSTFSINGIVLSGRYDMNSDALNNSNTIEAWEALSRRPGKYLVRFPDGTRRTGALSSVSISQEDDFTAKVSAEFVEVGP